jgi:phosphatidylserine/phosphatidylglycerophosphate/cardiolipin synthase-like enzyme
LIKKINSKGYLVMKRSLRPIILVLCLVIFLTLPATPMGFFDGGGGKTEWSVYFSPKGGCAPAIVEALNKAQTTILVQAYSFTSAPIAQALVKAHQRGVKVQVILDKSQRTDKYSSADFLNHANIPTLIDAAHAIAHNKIVIIDDQTVITGSFNFTKAAEERNAKNLLIIQDKNLVKKYTDNWRNHANHAEPYTGKNKAGNAETATKMKGEE